VQLRDQTESKRPFISRQKGMNSTEPAVAGKAEEAHVAVSEDAESALSAVAVAILLAVKIW